MDISSIFGLSLAVIMFMSSIFLGGNPLNLYMDFPSVVLVIFGSLASTIISNDMATIKSIPNVLNKFWKKDNYNIQDIITQLVGFSESARKDGLLSLDDAVKDVDDQFLSTGLRLMVDGTDPIIIKRILELELEKAEERHDVAANFFSMWAAYAPAWGMFGTVIGLIGMMANLADASSIGKGMALALITTLYGSMLANMWCIPVASKLAERHAQEMQAKMIMVEGILSIQGGENPRLLEQKLFSFLPPKERPAAKDVE